jgi:2-dehydropantoate 2-reductase
MNPTDRGRGAPRRIQRVVLCGAGAVGSAYAARLHDLDPAGLAVVAGGERRARLEREGITVNGRRIPLRCVSPGEPAPPADLLLVAVKQHHLAAAVEDVRSAVGDRTIILSLLNGITSEAVLGDAFGPARVLPAFVVGNDVVRDGASTRYSRIGRLVFGAPSNDPADPRVVAVKDLLDRAGIPAVVPADILREQWWKFMLNVGVNQVSAVLRAPYGAFALAEVQDLTRRAALEVVALSAREGVALAPADADGIFPILATLAPDGKTSMLQDVEAGRKTEVEIFAGAVVERGRRHGVATPVNEVLLGLIGAIERLAGARR